MRLRRPLLWLLVLLATTAALLALTGRRLAELAAGAPPGAASGSVTEGLPLMPPGFWSTGRELTPPPEPDRAGAEERARLVSLPYLGGRTRASEGEPTGVVHHDPERARPGVNLYNSGHGHEAILIDMEGRVLHRWRYPFEEAFPGVPPLRDTAFFRRVHLLPGGRLLALYQTGGLVFLDRGSRLLGRCRGNFYNDFWVGGDGRIWTLAKEARSAGGGAERLDDFLVLLRHDGDGRGCREERRISITEAFRRSDFADLLEPTAAAGDVLHANAVTELDGALAARSPILAAGNLLVSLRELDLVAIVDPAAGRVVWAQRGPWDRQHDPSLLPSGRILLFDNGHRRRPSRLVEVDPLTGEVAWSWQGDPPEAFYSHVAGTCARLPGGNTLVTESVPGRAFELDPEGRVVWEFFSPHRAGAENELVATLFELQRLPASSWPPAAETSRR